MTKVTTYIESELIFAKKPENGNFKDLTGMVFGRFLVLGFAGVKNHLGHWYCKCNCSVLKKVCTSALKSGHIKSCGCLKKEVVSMEKTTHGHSGNGKSKTYKKWAGMFARCYNEKEKSYSDYGGRGIQVCVRWKKFENFLSDMGLCPDGLTLERNDVNGDYCPENCCWATRKEQANNKRNNRVLVFNNETKTLAQWAEKLEMDITTLYSRLSKLGWSLEKALTTPLNNKVKLANEVEKV